MLSPKILA
jgi:hypothetical protein